MGKKVKKGKKKAKKAEEEPPPTKLYAEFNREEVDLIKMLESKTDWVCETGFGWGGLAQNPAHSLARAHDPRRAFSPPALFSR